MYDVTINMTCMYGIKNLYFENFNIKIITSCGRGKTLKRRGHVNSPVGGNGIVYDLGG